MKKIVILLVLGMVLVGMAPTAMSEEHNGFGWSDPNDADNPDNGVDEPPYNGGEDDGGDNEHEQAQNGEQLQNDGPQKFGDGKPQNEHDG